MVAQTDKLDESIEAKANRLIDGLRDFVLVCNQDGDFAKIGIAPLIFAPDFEGRVQSLVELQERGSSGKKVKVAYYFQHAVFPPSGYLRVTVQPDVTGAHNLNRYIRGSGTVDLVSFSAKVAENEFFVGLLPKAAAMLEDFFPGNVVAMKKLFERPEDTQQLPIPATCEDTLQLPIPATCSAARRRKPTSDSRLSQALQKYRAKVTTNRHDETQSAQDGAALCDVTNEMLPVAVPIRPPVVAARIGTENDEEKGSSIEVVADEKTRRWPTNYHQKMIVVVLVAVAFFLWFHPTSS